MQQQSGKTEAKNTVNGSTEHIVSKLNGKHESDEHASQKKRLTKKDLSKTRYQFNKSESESSDLLPKKGSSERNSLQYTIVTPVNSNNPTPRASTTINSSTNQGLKNLTKLFEKDTTLADVAWWTTLAIGPGFAARVTYDFGGGFAKELFNNLNNHFRGKDLTPEAQEDYRVTAAIIAAVVNGAINTNSLKLATVAVKDDLGKWHHLPTKSAKFLNAFSIGSKIAIALIGALPQFQIVKDSAESGGWTPAWVTSEQILNVGINTVLNWRGLNGLASFAHTYAENFRGVPLLDKFVTWYNADIVAQRKIARALRYQLLDELNQGLPDGRKIYPNQLESLAEGKLSENVDSVKWKLFRMLSVVPPLFYSYGGFYKSVEKALADWGIIGDVLEWCAFGTKWAFLTRANYGFVQGVFEFFGEQNIEIQGFTLPPWAQQVIRIMLTAITIASLSGAYGTIEDFMFDNLNTLFTQIASMLIVNIAASAINYMDTKRLFIDRLSETINRARVKFVNNIHEYRTSESAEKNNNIHKYGATADDFRLRCMANLASKTDAEIIHLYTQKKGQKPATQQNSDTTLHVSIMNADEISAINVGLNEVQSDIEINHHFLESLGEIRRLNSDANLYGNFLLLHQDADSSNCSACFRMG